MPSANVSWPPSLTRFPTLFPPQPGVPGTGHTRGLRMDPNGKVIWVDPNHVDANDSRDGTEPDSPMRTVAAALTKCRAYMNDNIIVAPSSDWVHGNQAVGRATPIIEEVTVSTPGIRIVGLAPSSSLGVLWEPVTNGGTMITVNAMDTLIEGFCFDDELGTIGASTAIAAFWDNPPYGDNLTVRNCYFGEYLDYGIVLDFSYYADIHHNYFDYIDVAAIFNLNVEGDPDYARIHDNTFMGNTAAIWLLDSGGCTIYRNLISGNAGGTNNFINLTGGAANIVADNYFACTIAQYDVTCSDAGSGAWLNNHCSNGVPALPPV